MFNTFLNWSQHLLLGFSNAWGWLITPITIGDFHIAPLYLIGFSGLTIFFAIALIKWLAS